MNRGLADTSLYIAREVGRGVDESRVPEFLAVSVITYAELRAGVLATSDPTVRDRRLATLESIPRDSVVPIDVSVAAAWARLRTRLRNVGHAMKVNDSWIAATALVLGVPVITQDSDFDDVPELPVVHV